MNKSQLRLNEKIIRKVTGGDMSGNQLRTLKHINAHKHSIVVTPRQQGITTLLMSDVITSIMYGEMQNAFILIPKTNNGVDEYANRLQYILKQVPGIEKINIYKDFVQFEYVDVIHKIYISNKHNDYLTGGIKQYISHVIIEWMNFIDSKNFGPFFNELHRNHVSTVLTGNFSGNFTLGKRNNNFFKNVYIDAVQGKSEYEPLRLEWFGGFKMETNEKLVDYQKEIENNIGKTEWEDNYECKFTQTFT